MLRLVLAVALLIPFSFVHSIVADDLTGTWTGTANVVDSCSEVLVNWSSPATLYLTQSGNAYTGTLFLSEAQIACSPKAPWGSPISGTLAGTSLTASTPDPRLGFGSGSGSVNSLSIMLPGAEDPRTSLTLNMTRTSSTSPAGDLGGLYLGQITQTTKCANGTFTTAPGTISGALVHRGGLLIGTVRVVEPEHYDSRTDGSCFRHICTVTIDALFTAQISGTTVSGSIAVMHEEHCERSDGNSDVITFAGTISGDTISARAGDAEGSVEISLTRIEGVRRRSGRR